jgi:hypothetical protein
MLSRSARAVLDSALQKYRPGQSKPILISGIAQLKPALRLMMSYRLVLQDVVGARRCLTHALAVIRIARQREASRSEVYTRWLESVQVKEGADPEVYVAFSPRFERIWLELGRSTAPAGLSRP